MNHFIYSVDIATPRPLTTKEQYALIMAFDALLAEYPMEFEDWKISTTNETRPL